MIKDCRIWIFSILLLIAPRLLIAEAIVNIEDMRREGEIGFFTSVSLALSASRGNRVHDSISAQIRFDNNTDRYDSFLVLKKEERKTDTVKWDDAIMAHARLVFKNDSIYDLELFVQHGKSPFRRYLQRDVMGAGARITINDHARLGLGILTENEEDMNQLKTRTERVASYFHDDYEISENMDFNLTIYYQPSLDSSEDFKASAIGALDFKMNEKFKVTLQYNIFYDSRPPATAVKRDEGIATNFSYSF
jgi:putative salt-induced outer membrane protein YdiY